MDGLGFTPEYYVMTNFYLYDQLHQDLKAHQQSMFHTSADAG